MFTYANDFASFISANDRGERAEIDEEMFYYFLEVLPPVYMRRTVKLPDGRSVRAEFGFAEGAEMITAFWKEGTKFYAQRTEEMNRC